MRWLLIFGAFAGCDTPGREYAGVTAQRVQVAQSVFDVRVDGTRAQAIRINTEWAPRPEAVMPRAMVAFEQASGCRVGRMKGDQVIIEATLICDGKPPAPPRDLEYDCDVRVLYRGHAEVVCSPGI